MNMLHAILLAPDFRTASEEAPQVAVRLANAFGSRLTLLHVLNAAQQAPSLLYREREMTAAWMRDLAAKLTAQHVPVADSSVAEGQPADLIVRKAQEVEADLIVLGAGERDRLERFLPGPTAETVLQQA